MSVPAVSLKLAPTLTAAEPSALRGVTRYPGGLGVVVGHLDGHGLQDVDLDVHGFHGDEALGCTDADVTIHRYDLDAIAPL